jgi:lysozyme family protein
MADFEISFTRTFEREKGFVDPSPGYDGNDETNDGIDERYHPDIEVEDLTFDEKKDIYYRHYWLPARCFVITPQEAADQIFDAAFHCGPNTAVKLAQTAYNVLFPKDPLVIDGVMGPKTALTINALVPKYIKGWLNAMIYVRVCYYLEKLAEKPSKEPNRKGWLNRI